MDNQKLEKLLVGAMIKQPKYYLWDLKEVELALESFVEPTGRRTLERQVADIEWLKCSRQREVQIDEEGRFGTRLVFDALVASARKKRRVVFFARLNLIPKKLRRQVIEQGKANKEEQTDSAWVLVVEDGRGKKRWCVINDVSPETIESSFSALSEERDCIVLPTGQLVGSCRSLAGINQRKDLKQKIQYAISHFKEPSSSNSISKNKDTRMKPTQASKLSHLDRLEAESMHIIREVMAHAENPVMLYSVGKDSSVMLHLARKAFYPSAPPFPLMHVDTRWKFQAMYEFRDQMANDSGMDLIVHINPEGIEKNINPFDHGSALHTDIMKTQGLKQALDLHQFDVAFGGARRDEEKSRAKERIFSFRSTAHRWDPKNQRPELWNLYNCRKAPGESVRVFPLSNWTELDIWQYIYREQIPIVPLYFAAERPIVNRNGMLMMVDDDRMQLLPGETIETRLVRFRTLGCYPLTGAVESTATDLSQIVLELLQSRTSERQGRAIDSDSSASMEKKKQEGYF